MRTLIVVLLGGLAVLAVALVSARLQPRAARHRHRTSDDTGLLFLSDAGADSSSADPSGADCDTGGSDAGDGCDGGSGDS